MDYLAILGERFAHLLHNRGVQLLISAFENELRARDGFAHKSDEGEVKGIDTWPRGALLLNGFMSPNADKRYIYLSHRMPNVVDAFENEPPAKRWHKIPKTLFETIHQFMHPPKDITQEEADEAARLRVEVRTLQEEIGRLMKRISEVDRPAVIEFESKPYAYVCPEPECGCMWRDNGNDTMSLFNGRQKSCNVCEFMNLYTLTPLYKRRFVGGLPFKGNYVIGERIELLHPYNGPINTEPKAPGGVVDLFLFCPNCKLQHVDKVQDETDWAQRPHRTHRCEWCSYEWRPSNRFTRGVSHIDGLDGSNVVPSREALAIHRFTNPKQNEIWLFNYVGTLIAKTNLQVLETVYTHFLELQRAKAGKK